MTAGPITHDAPRAPNRFIRGLDSEHLVLWLALAYFLVLLPITPGLAGQTNLENLLLTLLPLFVVAIGQTIVLISGGIDLSVCSTMALASVLGAMAMNGENGWFAGSRLAVPAGVAIMLVTGLAVGAVNGLAVAWLRLPPFIVTLTSMMFFSGFAIWLTKSQSVYGLPAAFNALGGTLVFALPLALGLGAAAQWWLARTLYGHWLYAVGGNSRMARISGVPVVGVTAGAYLASGVFAALAAALYTGQAETGSPVLGQRLLLDVIAAVVIGGTSLFGGRGQVMWTLFGVLFIKLIDNSLNLLNLPLATITMVKGGIILVAALLDAARTRRRHNDTLR